MPARSFESHAGGGVAGDVDGQRVLVGSARFLAENGIGSAQLAATAETHRTSGATAVFIAAQGKPLGFIAIADPIKPTSADVVKALKKARLRVVMLTGDNGATARAVAARLGIEDIRADVRPDQKAQIVADLKAAGHVVAMAGDGINDAPALAAADVGIAMGTGTDIAMETAGVTLLGGDLRSLLRAIRLSKATMANIRQNLVFAFVYNAVGVPIAAGVLYPVFGLLLSPMLAALAMALSSVSVIGNSLRLRSLTLD
jgi:P-type Cu+ transporter